MIIDKEPIIDEAIVNCTIGELTGGTQNADLKCVKTITSFPIDPVSGKWIGDYNLNTHYYSVKINGNNINLISGKNYGEYIKFKYYSNGLFISNGIGNIYENYSLPNLNKIEIIGN